MGRTVGDVALFLDTQAGKRLIDPISFAAPNTPYVQAIEKPTAPAKIGYSHDLGIAPVDQEVRDICARSMQIFEKAGSAIFEAHPNLDDAEDIFQTLRAAQFAASYKKHLDENRELLKPEVIWNIEKGLELSIEDINNAELARGALYLRTLDFFSSYDLLACPAVVVPPFDVEQRYVTEAGGKEFNTYVSWLVMSFALTLTACPSISVPCGFTSEGLPVGLQLMAPRGDEALLLSVASFFEQASGSFSSKPIDPIVRH